MAQDQKLKKQINSNTVSQDQTVKTQKESINNTTSFLMISTAAFFDVLILSISIFDFIPVIGTVISSISGFIISFFALLTFITWFLIHGIKLITFKNITSMTFSFVPSWIPFFSLLPTWTGGVSYMIFSHRSKAFKKITNPTSVIKPEKQAAA